MPKQWKYEEGANSKIKGYRRKGCNHTRCVNYDILEGCLLGKNFRNCDLYKVHPSMDTRVAGIRNKKRGKR